MPASHFQSVAGTEGLAFLGIEGEKPRGLSVVIALLDVREREGLISCGVLAQCIFTCQRRMTEDFTCETDSVSVKYTVPGPDRTGKSTRPTIHGCEKRS